MSQDNLVRMSCSQCKEINYWTSRNKRTGDAKLALQKHCSRCRTHTEHKETKKK